MSKREGYIPEKDRKKILLLCDDIRVHSGVATMAREFVINSAHKYNWFQVGAAIRHPDADKKKVIDISDDINKKFDMEDADVKILPSNGYGDAQLIRRLMKEEKPDAIFIFTDPRYWVWLFEIEREVRSKIPIFWLNIWDDFPIPLYNERYYESVDLLMGISKQTKLINELVLGDKAKDKIIEYVPHGIDEEIFRPLAGEFEKEFAEFKDKLFKGKDIEFVFFFNSRNIGRKHPHDLILAYRLFCDKIGKEKADKTALIMHTTAVDKHGTDLNAVKAAIAKDRNVFFSQEKLSSAQMNLMYNVADVTILPSSNEGWGLSLTESLMAGTMIIANVTGGMQDQMRFVDHNGEWFTPSSKVPSNHRKTYTECGNWAEPVFPSNISIQGSVGTPFIYDDRLAPEDLAEAMNKVYELPKHVRTKYGQEGREWVTSEEAQMTSKKMSDNIIRCMEKAWDNFTPRKSFELHKFEPLEDREVEHELINYSYD